MMRMNQDGSDPRRVIPEPVTRFNSISPDGEWATVRLVQAGAVTTPLVAYPLRGGRPVPIADNGTAFWSRDGRLFYVERPGMGDAHGGKTIVFSVPAGRAVPDLPASGIHGDKDLEGLRIVKVIADPGLEIGNGAGGIYAGPDLSLYAFVRRNVQRNLYRIPLP